MCQKIRRMKETLVISISHTDIITKCLQSYLWIRFPDYLRYAGKLKSEKLRHIPPLFFSFPIFHLGIALVPVIWVRPNFPSEVPYTISSPESPKHRTRFRIDKMKYTNFKNVVQLHSAAHAKRKNWISDVQQNCQVSNLKTNA